MSSSSSNNNNSNTAGGGASASTRRRRRRANNKQNTQHVPGLGMVKVPASSGSASTLGAEKKVNDAPATSSKHAQHAGGKKSASRGGEGGARSNNSSNTGSNSTGGGNKNEAGPFDAEWAVLNALSAQVQEKKRRVQEIQAQLDEMRGPSNDSKKNQKKTETKSEVAAAAQAQQEKKPAQKKQPEATAAVADGEEKKTKQQQQQQQSKPKAVGLRGESNEVRSRLQKANQSFTELASKKKTLLARLADARKVRDQRQEALRPMRDALPYKNVKDEEYFAKNRQQLESQVAKLETRMEQEALSPPEERKLLSEVSSLRAQLNKLDAFEVEQKQLDEEYARSATVIKEQRKETDQLLDALQVERVELRNRLKELHAALDKSREAGAVLVKERNQLRKEMQELNQQWKKEMDALKEKKKERQKVMAEQRAARKAEYAARDKERKEREQKRREQKEKENDLRVPFEEELSICKRVASYLKKMDASLSSRKPDTACPHGMEAFVWFEKISVAPPITRADIAATIEQVQQKKARYLDLQKKAIEKKQQQAEEKAAKKAAQEAAKDTEKPAEVQQKEATEASSATDDADAAEVKEEDPETEDVPAQVDVAAAEPEASSEPEAAVTTEDQEAEAKVEDEAEEESAAGEATEEAEPKEAQADEAEEVEA
eukprot:CAMPEP_0174233952 /NCGR_PEP_ID=MMETSP0417-20130205/3849_1 /TAXON_ID=242541 /ORGANISM="Mayorella sp, Strain BSH-02190019" /LENGTH=659 /DNA_ID=CAMNT_0015312249 /DNA_START=105 /DNA_END=2084 /DNA_ORIENTATION=-